MVAEFNSDPSRFVFLISTRAGGVGLVAVFRARKLMIEHADEWTRLNITAANKVVIFDPNWNPRYDNAPPHPILSCVNNIDSPISSVMIFKLKIVHTVSGKPEMSKSFDLS